MCIQPPSLPHLPLFSASQLIQQAHVAPVLLMVHVAATISSVRKEGWKERKRENNKGEKGRVRTRAAGVDECFEFVWRRGTGMRQEPAPLTSMDCSLGNMPAKCVCACVSVSVCVCVLHVQTAVRSNHDLRIKVEVFDDGDRDSCHNKIPIHNSSSLSPSFPLCFSPLLYL